MKEEFRTVANEMVNSPLLSRFEKKFAELCCIAEKNKFAKLIRAFPEIVLKINELKNETNKRN